jgi:membrane associated rhomboid family serine protease
MSLADRDYHRNHPRESGGFMSRITPVVKGLLIANVGIFFLDLFVGHSLISFGAFAVQSAVFELRLWEFVTFQFLHASLGHVLFNCIGLYFFGPWMERWWGSKKFLGFYLLCGGAGAAFFTLLMLLNLVPGDITSPLVGASAGIYGIFIGVAIIAPDLRVALLFPPIELSMRQLAIILMVISAGAILLNIGGNEGGEAGHLGGAIVGFILMRYPRLLGGGPGGETLHTHRFAHRTAPKLRPRSELLAGEDSAVDMILDKVSRDGFQSLSQAERDILRQASERHLPDP